MTTKTRVQIPEWVEKRIIKFFNKALNVKMIVDGTPKGKIVDDPSNGGGNTIGPVVAARILRERKSLPGGFFTSLAQIDAVKGVGEDALRDLAYSFNNSAAEEFKRSMYESGTIYETNWPLEYFRYPFQNKEAFDNIVNDPAKLIDFVAEKILEICDERNVDAKARDAMIADLHNSDINEEEFDMWIPGADCDLAKWFYKFAHDNWFGWKDIHKQTSFYFNRKANEYLSMMRLTILNFQNRGIIRVGVSPGGLPVVVNQPEQAITFWISELYD